MLFNLIKKKIIIKEQLEIVDFMFVFNLFDLFYSLFLYYFLLVL